MLHASWDCFPSPRRVSQASSWCLRCHSVQVHHSTSASFVTSAMSLPTLIYVDLDREIVFTTFLARTAAPIAAGRAPSGKRLPVNATLLAGAKPLGIRPSSQLFKGWLRYDQ